MNMYIYIYVYMYICTYIYIHIYVYVCGSRVPGPPPMAWSHFPAGWDHKNLRKINHFACMCMHMHAHVANACICMHMLAYACI